jgi:hypothetical protein
MKNWKTTIIGIGLGVLPIIQTAIDDPQVNWWKVGIGCLIIAFGIVSKDHNVTGGSVQQ